MRRLWETNTLGSRVQLEFRSLTHVQKQKSPIWMKIAGSHSPGTPGEVIWLGSATSIFIKSPAFCQLQAARNHIQPQATHCEMRGALGAADNKTHIGQLSSGTSAWGKQNHSTTWPHTMCSVSLSHIVPHPVLITTLSLVDVAVLILGMRTRTPQKIQQFVPSHIL